MILTPVVWAWQSSSLWSTLNLHQLHQLYRVYQLRTLFTSQPCRTNLTDLQILKICSFKFLISFSNFKVAVLILKFKCFRYLLLIVEHHENHLLYTSCPASSQLWDLTDKSSKFLRWWLPCTSPRWWTRWHVGALSTKPSENITDYCPTRQPTVS